MKQLKWVKLVRIFCFFEILKNNDARGPYTIVVDFRKFLNKSL